jgi:hypothetical protein
VSKTETPVLTACLDIDATGKRPGSVVGAEGAGTDYATTTVTGATAQHGQQYSKYSYG